MNMNNNNAEQTKTCSICGISVVSDYYCVRCRSAVLEDLLMRIKYHVQEHPDKALPISFRNELLRTIVFSLNEWKEKLAKEAEEFQRLSSDDILLYD